MQKTSEFFDDKSRLAILTAVNNKEFDRVVDLLESNPALIHAKSTSGKEVYCICWRNKMLLKFVAYY